MCEYKQFLGLAQEGTENAANPGPLRVKGSTAGELIPFPPTDRSSITSLNIRPKEIIKEEGDVTGTGGE